MSKIKIKNFGPIKEGYKGESGDEWINIEKVTVFIGNQGSGKSTVAKVISTLTWMEKAINRGDITEPKSIQDFKKHFKYQNLQAYFNPKTTIEYYGEAYSILFGTKESNYPVTGRNNQGNYIVPKISYVPAERNFLSVIKNATGVKGLPETLFDFAEELKIAQSNMPESELKLPINNVYYKYDKESDTSYIKGNGFSVNLLQSSSGFQSLVPLYLVSSTLAKTINNGTEINSSNINVSQLLRMNNVVTKIMLDVSLSDKDKLNLVDDIRRKFKNDCFINIVEEPEQNLYPSSQRQILNSLLHFNNMNEGNRLIITTHSPYLISYLTLAVKADNIYATLVENKFKMGDPEFGYTNDIVPMSSTIKSNDLAIYELDEKEGTITKLGSLNGIPSDNNYLNKALGDVNKLFDSLLEIQEDL